ncbi:MAG: signal peptidase II, partial [Bacteroidales bacterium]
MGKKYLPFWIIGIVLLLDQAFKIWIKLHLQLGEEIYVFDWFRIHFLENEGMAFGFSFGGDWGK